MAYFLVLFLFLGGFPFVGELPVTKELTPANGFTTHKRGVPAVTGWNPSNEAVFPFVSCFFFSFSSGMAFVLWAGAIPSFFKPIPHHLSFFHDMAQHLFFICFCPKSSAEGKGLSD
ncbi:MAG: hypothetical protein MJ077_06175 [Oscillospiraceae bacterium]|nr:hypothetical protein [Oscillospiraceae bacterium]